MVISRAQHSQVRGLSGLRLWVTLTAIITAQHSQVRGGFLGFGERV